MINLPPPPPRVVDAATSVTDHCAPARIITFLVVLHLLSAVTLQASEPLPLTPELPTNDVRQVRGLLVSETRTTLAAELPSTITGISVSMGERFKKNQLLVELDNTTYQARMKLATAERQSAEEQLAAKEKLRSLRSISELSLQESRLKLAKAEAEIELLEIKLRQSTIKAPFAGRVIERMVNPYQYVATGTPLLEIIDDSQLYVQMLIPSSWISDINAGDRVSLVIDELHAEYQAVIDGIGAAIDPNSQTLELRATISDTNPRLIAGMSGTVTFGAGSE